MSALAAPRQDQSFTVAGGQFLLDGKPFQIVSGEMHYERIPRAYWRARLRMAKAMGLNTVATYVFWNIHEPQPGKFNFSGNADLAEFIREAGQEGLKVLLRAGPYSCAEWEFGGFPAWLMKDPLMRAALRSNDPAFMVPARQWLMRLGKEVAPLQIGRGGPIIGVQIENEYGDFGDDNAYLEQLHRIFLKAGFDASLLYTANPTRALEHGSIPGVYSAVNFGIGHAQTGLDALARFRPGAPLLVSEYWPGWFDHWGQPHQTRPTAPQIRDLDTILRRGAGINIYMFHGGTSFGFMSGSSWTKNQFLPDVTSYDYDAPLDEAGHPTAKYFAYRAEIEQYLGHALPAVPPSPPVETIAPFMLRQCSPLWAGLPAQIASAQLEPMEDFGQSYGFMLYRTQLRKVGPGKMHLEDLNDYALVYLDGKLVGTLDRTEKQTTLPLDVTRPDERLDLLVENSGRINSTRMMRGENKGLRLSASFEGKPLAGWKIYMLPMNPASIADAPGWPAAARFAGAKKHADTLGGPAFYRGTFKIKGPGTPADTFLDVRDLGKGAVWINGHAIGRYWNIGPQETLYVPGPWLHRGSNRVLVLDLFPRQRLPRLAGLAAPILDAPARMDTGVPGVQQGQAVERSQSTEVQ